LEALEVRARRLSHARRQVGEAAAAGDDRIELGEFFVAAVVAAVGDEIRSGPGPTTAFDRPLFMS